MGMAVCDLADSRHCQLPCVQDYLRRSQTARYFDTATNDVGDTIWVSDNGDNPLR
jgi:hypothetical protein